MAEIEQGAADLPEQEEGEENAESRQVERFDEERDIADGDGCRNSHHEEMNLQNDDNEEDGQTFGADDAQVQVEVEAEEEGGAQEEGEDQDQKHQWMPPGTTHVQWQAIQIALVDDDLEAGGRMPRAAITSSATAAAGGSAMNKVGIHDYAEASASMTPTIAMIAGGVRCDGPPVSNSTPISTSTSNHHAGRTQFAATISDRALAMPLPLSAATSAATAGEASLSVSASADSNPTPSRDVHGRRSVGAFSVRGTTITELTPATDELRRRSSAAAMGSWSADFALGTVPREETSHRRLPVPTAEGSDDTTLSSQETYEPQTPFHPDYPILEARLVDEAPAERDVENHCYGPSTNARPPDLTSSSSTTEIPTALLFDAEPSPSTKLPWMWFGWAALAAATALILVALLVQRDTGVDTSNLGTGSNIAGNATSATSPQATTLTTLRRVRQDGFFRCGVLDEVYADSYNRLHGAENQFDAHLCYAVAAAIFGVDDYRSRVEVVRPSFPERFAFIANGTADVMVASVTKTTERDVYLNTIATGLSFSDPYLYLPAFFGGVPQYVTCAEKLLFDGVNGENCEGLSFCVLDGTLYADILGSKVPKYKIHKLGLQQGLGAPLQSGLCNVLFPVIFNVAKTIIEEGYTGNYTRGKSMVVSEPVALVTRKDDSEWSSLVRWVLQALFAAEQQGITKDNILAENVPLFREVDVFGPSLQRMLTNAVAAVGNYGEVFNTTLNLDVVVRPPADYVNRGTTGVIQSIPFGNLEDEGPGPSLGGTLNETLNRGFLRCAIRTSARPGLAEKTVGLVAGDRTSFQGMDVDYCSAVSVAIFGLVDAIEFVEVSNDEEGFQVLERGGVDVFAGVMISLDREVRELSTGVGFSFSQPYFYNNSADILGRDPDSNCCLATRKVDPQWSSFVAWIVTCTFYAEEQGITSSSSNMLPTVNTFGMSFTRMMRDAVMQVGNYGDIYQRNMEQHTTRSGLNLLNSLASPKPGPNHFPLPGLFA